MEIYTVSLFGHREIEDLRRLEEVLSRLVRDLLWEKPFVSFLVGRSGDFDECAARVIKEAQKKYGKERAEITLVLPYAVSDLPYYEEYYDAVLIPPCVQGVNPKGAHGRKNQWMVEQSDLVVGWIERKQGGAYKAVEYARRHPCRVVLLCDAPQ